MSGGAEELYMWRCISIGISVEVTFQKNEHNFKININDWIRGKQGRKAQI